MTTSEEFPTATRIRRAVRRQRLPATAIALLCAVAAATHGADQQQAQVSAQSRAIDLMTTDVPLPNSGSPADPNRIHDDLGRFSFTAPVGWVRSANPTLTYGTTLLTNPGHPDGVILVGPLDLKLFASSYPSHPDNTKSAIRLASDMGTFLMPYPGNRINWDTQPFSVNGLPAATSYFETKYEDARHEDSQLWVGVVGHDVNRFFALWRGTASTPIDRAAAQSLAESVDPD